MSEAYVVYASQAFVQEQPAFRMLTSYTLINLNALQPESFYQSWQIIWSLVQLILFIVIIEHKRGNSWCSKKAVEDIFKNGPA
jgi:hypothetical protein